LGSGKGERTKRRANGSPFFYVQEVRYAGGSMDAKEPADVQEVLSNSIAMHEHKYYLKILLD